MVVATVFETVRSSAAILSAAGVDTPEHDVKLLLAEMCIRDRNVSMNRGERLKAIEQRIAKLKSDADTKAAAALSAASEAQDVRDSLDALRVQGENRRTELEGKQDQLQSDAAKQAVQTVLLQSKIDDANRRYAQQQADAAGSANPGQSAFRK